MKKIYITSLGCPKNTVDTEVMIGLLEQQGWALVDDARESDVLLVNTCGFIQPAVEEGVDEILEHARVKEISGKQKLVVTGCMVQRYGKALQKEIPEIDALIGTEEIAGIGSMLQRLLAGHDVTRDGQHPPFLMDARIPRKRITPHYRAWMKITEGCDNHCSYCMIPSLRGRLRSRTVADLLDEARILEDSGVRELSLIAQDLTAFGVDHEGVSQLNDLLVRLLEKTAIPWLRLLYLYPTGIDQRLLEIMASSPRIVPYLDIPFQHVSGSILQRMNRHYTYDDIVRLIDRLREKIPDIALRTTFLLGFPGETERDILLLEEFLTSVKLDHVGIFPYANEEGCPSEFFPDQVEEQEKTRRVEHIHSVQSAISKEIQKKYVGRVEPVLVEGVSPETDLLLEGRTRFQAPEIDGCVYINDGTANIGDIVPVAITESQVYDLVGGIVSETVIR